MTVETTPRKRLFARAIGSIATKISRKVPKPDPAPIHTIPHDNFWGHHIEWTDFDKRSIWGHFDNARGVKAFVLTDAPMPPSLEVGSVIRGEMQSGRMALFRVTELDWQSNPHDMFFGKVEDIGYEDPS